MLSKFIVAIVLSLVLLSGAAYSETRKDVSLVLYNGRIFTADGYDAFVEAVAIDGDRIVETGTSKDIRAKYLGGRQIDLGQRLVTPGFNDAHLHFSGIGLSLLRVDLNGSKTLEEAKSRIAAKIKDLPKGAWVLGRGWDHTLWANRLPTAADLDDIAPDNPVFVQRVDGHISWSNSLAFKLAKVTKDSSAPTGGEIVRLSNGEPAGVLKETAQDLVGSAVPNTTRDEAKKGLELALKQAREFGLTSVQSGGDFKAWPIYLELLKEGKLTVRASIWQDFFDDLGALTKQRDDFEALKIDPLRLKRGILKGYMDGTLGSRTAAMIEPFSDEPVKDGKPNLGIPRMPAGEMIKMIVERDAAGFQIGLHAIGDQANRTALEGFEKSMFNIRTGAIRPAYKYTQTPDGMRIELRRSNVSMPAAKAVDTIAAVKFDIKTLAQKPMKNAASVTRLLLSSRHRIEHAQVVHPSDFAKFAELGIIASMQPTHAITDKRWAPDRLGPYRTLGSYAWNTFKANGVRVAFGTDAPVESANTYQTLYAAVTRQSVEGEPAGGWMPQEKMSMADAIRSYTHEPAYAEFAEYDKGIIKAGMLADLVVHDQNLFRIAPEEILKTRPIYTIFNGKIVYDANRQ